MQGKLEDISDQDRVEPQSHRSPLVRFLLVSAGTLALALGLIGIFLPVLPTTPFVLVAAACYARGSQRFYNALLENRYVGPYLLSWRKEHRIPLHAKILAITMIVLSVGASIIWVVPVTAVKWLLAVIAVSVIAYICHFPH